MDSIPDPLLCRTCVSSSVKHVLESDINGTNDCGELLYAVSQVIHFSPPCGIVSQPLRRQNKGVALSATRRLINILLSVFFGGCKPASRDHP